MYICINNGKFENFVADCKDESKEKIRKQIYCVGVPASTCETWS